MDRAVPVKAGNDPELMLPREIADMYRVDPKTASRWIAAGKFPEEMVVVTPGGHRRIRRAEFMVFFRKGGNGLG